MFKKLIAWITVCALLLTFGLVGDVLDICGAAFAALEVSAQAEGDFTIDANGVLTKYNGKGTNVTVPEGVTALGSYAFSGCTSLTKVTLQEGVTEIGCRAFDGCSSLTEISLPSGVKTINTYAFSNCGALVHCAYNSDTARAVSKVNHDFYVAGDTSYALRYVTVDSKEKLALIKYHGTNVKVPVIPTYANLVSNYAFSGHAEITEIAIPKNIATIGESMSLSH